MTIEQVFRAFFIAVIALVIGLALLVAAALINFGRATASDINHPTPQERVACGADFYRFCSAIKDETILSCLQRHRALLSRSCQDLLRENAK